jgi:excisionase family DNA binding protein
VKNQPEPPLLLTRPQVAKLLGVSISHVQKLGQMGILTPIRLGTAVRYRRDELEAALERLSDEARRRRGE